jgi:hypothetical protein
VLGGRPLRIVPILAGLGAQQASGEDPDRDARVARFMDAVRELVEARPGRVVVVAGADRAHVGPRFGDAEPYDAARRARLEAPIWSLLRSVAGGARGRVLHHDQTIDAEDGSIVSHAALGFYA